jgi:hypothetical protein
MATLAQVIEDVLETTEAEVRAVDEMLKELAVQARDAVLFGELEFGKFGVQAPLRAEQVASQLFTRLRLRWPGLDTEHVVNGSEVIYVLSA